MKQWPGQIKIRLCFGLPKNYRKDYLRTDTFLKDKPGPWDFFRRNTISFAEVIKIMIGDHLAESFVFFEESIDLGFVSVFVDSIVTVILFDAVNESKEHVDLFLVFDFAFLCRGQVDFVHWVIIDVLFKYYNFDHWFL